MKPKTNEQKQELVAIPRQRIFLQLNLTCDADAGYQHQLQCSANRAQSSKDILVWMLGHLCSIHSHIFSKIVSLHTSTRAPIM